MLIITRYSLFLQILTSWTLSSLSFTIPLNSSDSTSFMKNEGSTSDGKTRYMVKFVDKTSFMDFKSKDTDKNVILSLDDLNVVVLNLDAKGVEDMNAQKDIVYTEPDCAVYPASDDDGYTSKDFVSPASHTQYVPYGIDLVNPKVWSGFQRLHGKDDFAEGFPKVCIIDSGYYRDHPDLPSAHVTGHTGANNEYHPFEDTSGHGTHVAGIIAATNNNIGYRGVVGSDTLPLHIVRIFGDGMGGTCPNPYVDPPVGGWPGGRYSWTSEVMNAVTVCKDAGAKIVNMSLESKCYTQTEVDFYFLSHLEDGMLIVAAAGNKAKEGNPMMYPAGYKGVVSVAAIDYFKKWADFSTYNSGVNIAAPGVLIDSTYCHPYDYTKTSGTSMAAPHVTGVAALVWSYYKYWSGENISTVLAGTAQSIRFYSFSNGSQQVGHGMVRADLAKQYMDAHFFDLTIQIKPDKEAYRQTFWDVKIGVAIVASGGLEEFNPGSEFMDETGKIYRKTLRLPKLCDSLYQRKITFSIHDSGFNGLYSGNGDTVIDGHCWSNHVETPDCGYWRLLVDGIYWPSRDVQSLTYVNTHFNSSHPTDLGHCTSPPLKLLNPGHITSQNTEYFDLEIEILPDYWAPYETRWEIVDTDGTTVIFQGGDSDFIAYELYQRVVQLSYLNDSGLHYTFRIIDDYGDGLDWYSTANGYFKIFMHGTELHGSTDGVHFGYGTDIDFGLSSEAEQFALEIEILPDYWAPYETTWEILDTDGTTVIFQGGYSDFTAYELYQHEVQLSYLHGSGLYYTFRIIDDWGDGLDDFFQDNGYFKISIHGRELHGSTDGTHFGYGTDIEFNRYYEYDPEFTFDVSIFPDEWAPSETRWELLDIDSATILAQGGESNFTAYEPYSYSVEGLPRYCNTNNFYTFRIVDDYGDGLHWYPDDDDYYDDYKYYWYYFENAGSSDQKIKKNLKQKKMRSGRKVNGTGKNESRDDTRDKVNNQSSTGTSPGHYMLFVSGTMLPLTETNGVDFGFEETIQFQGCF